MPTTQSSKPKKKRVVPPGYKRNRKKAPVSERFWPKVIVLGIDECWPWIGCKDPNGYGRFNTGIGSRTALAHRMAWTLVNGPIPDGLYACHKCDNPTCVNPNHLFLGTAADNLQDMYRKNRAVVGEAHVNSKLSKDTVLAIRSATGSQKSIADRFGTTQKRVSKIRRGLVWRHLL